MKKIKIIKNGVVTNQNMNPLESDEVKDLWLAKEIANGSFGKNERWLPVQKDRDGVEYVSGENISEAIDTRTVKDDMLGDRVEKKFAAEYTVVEEDMTAEIAAAEADKKEQREIKDHLKGLKKADLKTVSDCADAILKILKHLRADK